MSRDPELEDLVSEFATKLTTLMESRTVARMQALLAPLTQGGAMHSYKPVMRPRQLCPVPGCQNTAAPRYGMVCVEHKDLSKAEIKKFREARKAEQSGHTINGVQETTTQAPSIEALPKRRRRVTVPAR